jgi:KaiC/GvpD/RAD55 family RecA-like ATPase
MSLTELQKPPENHLILLSGPPGAGKYTFCHHMVLTIAMGRPARWDVTKKED